MTRRPGTLRVVGGAWRSRLVEFDAGAGVRPTPDRVRQTVFDWLSPLLDGSRVLDLFAGSGAMGLEALSRGAAQAVFVDSGRVQTGMIRAALAKLNADDRAEVLQTDAASFLNSVPRRVFDLAFLDPPYAAGLLEPALAGVRPWLAPVHRIYLEWPKGQGLTLPGGCTLLREKAAGQVSYGLAFFASAGEPM